MPRTLDNLLQRVRDGLATGAEREEARRLAALDRRLPEDLRAAVSFEGPDAEADAAALLAVLGHDDLFARALKQAVAGESESPAPSSSVQGEAPWLDEDPWVGIGQALSEGLHAEAQAIDLAESLADALDLPWTAPVAEAVRAEAGPAPEIDAEIAGPTIDVAAAVSSEAGRVELSPVVLAALQIDGLPVGPAVRAEMGPSPDLGEAVLVALDHEPLGIAQAVRAEAGPAELAPQILAELGQPLLPVAEAVAAEAGSGPGADAVCARLEIATLPVAEAVHAEAGSVDVAERVAQTLAPEVLAGLLDHQLDATTHRLAAQAVDADRRGRELTAMADLGRDLRSALHAEAGPIPSLWGEVGLEIGIEEPERVEGWDEDQVPTAVAHEAGEIDVVDAVMAEVSRPSPASMPLAEMPMHSLPPVANGRMWGVAGFLAAAAALFVALGGPWFGAQDPSTQALSPLPMTFASAQEVVVEELEYGDGVQVFQTAGEGGALIIWFEDEGAML